MLQIHPRDKVKDAEVRSYSELSSGDTFSFHLFGSYSDELYLKTDNGQSVMLERGTVYQDSSFHSSTMVVIRKAHIQLED